MVELLPAFIAALVLVAAARIGRTILPAGVSEGLFVAGLSGAALLAATLNASNPAEAERRALLAASGLCAAWVLSSAVRDRRGMANDSVRAATFAHLGACCGSVAVGLTLARVANSGSLTRSAGVTAAGLMLAATVVWGMRCRAAHALRSAAALTMLLIVLLSQPHWIARHSAAITLTAGLAAIASLTLIAVEGLLAWRDRRRTWLSDPSKLADAPRRLAGLGFTVPFLACASLILVSLRPTWALAPFVAFLGGVAALYTFHRRGRAGVGELGLSLIACVVVLIGTAWLPSSAANNPAAAVAAHALIGAALASLHMLWLSRFWRQQLLNDHAWTTTGNLVPAARRLAQHLCLVCVALTIAVMRLSDRADLADWRVLSAGLLAAAAGCAVLRDGERAASTAGVLCAWPAVLSGVFLLGHGVANILGLSQGWALIAPAAAIPMLVAARPRSVQDDGQKSLGADCWTLGVLPAAVIYLGVWPRAGFASQWSWMIAASLVCVTFVIRGSRRPAAAGHVPNTGANR